jgi:hypothetical protein
MDVKQSKTLQNQLKAFLVKRQNIAQTEKKTRTISYLVAFPVWYIIYLQAFILYQEINAQGLTKISIISSINLLSMVFVGIILVINYSQPPKEKEKIDGWLWKRGQRRTILFLLVFLLQAIAQIFDKGVFGSHKYFVSASYLAYSLFFGCVLLIAYNPKLFFSKAINIIGTTSFFLFIGYMPIRLVALFGVEFNNSMFLWNIPAIIILIIGFRFIPLSIVQTAVMQIIEPDRLFSHLRSEHQIIQDQYKALQIKAKMEKEISLGIKTELIKLYAKEHNEKNKHYFLIGVVISLSIFTLTSLGDAFIQDILYGNIIKPILCKLIASFC